jgi:hypothetical protein
LGAVVDVGQTNEPDTPAQIKKEPCSDDYLCSHVNRQNDDPPDASPVQ